MCTGTTLDNDVTIMLHIFLEIDNGFTETRFWKKVSQLFWSFNRYILYIYYELLKSTKKNTFISLF